MEKFKHTKQEVRKNMFVSKIVEAGDTMWSTKKGIQRERIINEVGAEYKQINLLAEVIAEIVAINPELANNATITEAMSKFNIINEIRNS